MKLQRRKRIDQKLQQRKKKYDPKENKNPTHRLLNCCTRSTKGETFWVPNISEKKQFQDSNFLNTFIFPHFLTNQTEGPRPRTSRIGQNDNKHIRP